MTDSVEQVEVEELAQKFGIMIGDPISGFQIVGPFDSRDEANYFSEELNSGDWWVVGIYSPDEHRIIND